MSEKCHICGVDLSLQNPKSTKDLCPNCIRFKYLFLEILIGMIIIIGLIMYLINVNAGNIP